MKNISLKRFLTIIIFLLPIGLFAQKNGGGPVHLKIKRLNDAYIDVYHNRPSGTNKFPMLLFCQGSGYDSNTEGFLRLARQFEKIAVGVAIEKEGVNYGDKGDTLFDYYKRRNTIYNRLYDYLRVFQYMRASASWWNGEVYVIGGSEGGLLAGMIASFYPNVKAVAILSFGGALNFGEAWPISSGLQKKADGAGDAEIENEVNSVKDSLNYMRSNATWLKSYSGDDNTYAWWASITDLRLENTLIDLKIPIYLAQGAEDIMAPPISAQKLHEDFIRQGKTNLYYREYNGYSHGFSDKENQSHIWQVFTDAVKWILKKK